MQEKKDPDYKRIKSDVMRTCKCGGIIRENGKPFWDVLESCSCQNPVAIAAPIIITTITNAEPLKDSSSQEK